MGLSLDMSWFLFTYLLTESSQSLKSLTVWPINSDMLDSSFNGSATPL